ncbi:uncharacterized protein LOC110031008 [Phalaenopsis equestris]|uniref:uncharacterized protein LOC110031008 n=1 Tax=Phalaenopsis equestris TaxID=78828 RepID=UPI0009E35F3D|nr:uncharacterized protein LOC110031008 [Phalaenopsis equestris]XP_020589684.1 uncharacterized protein LOC110031008 [Phalaenopsis equestris]
MADFLSLKLVLIISLLSSANYCCKAQQADSVQIVARAALCFDNQTVTNGCTRWMRRIANKNVTKKGAARFCGSPCAGQMMLVFGCVEDILSNFQFYSPGLLLGVQSIFQMSCGGRTSAPNTDISTNTSASGNMVAEKTEVKAEATEAKAEKSMAKHWSSSTWIIPLAFAVVAALILYSSPRSLYS